MERLFQLVWAVVCTFVIWMSVAVVHLLAPNLTVFAVMMAFLGTLCFWLVMGLAQLKSKEKSSPEKAKRESSNGDARLALLMELMGEDERQALKQRLLGDLAPDGETVSLAELLASQNRQSHRS
ncbi:MAG: hypothetical protein HY866_01830 [Chloroflexi bacterium]|nr:hypothetical protein [Chloroflexota bacterium]